MDLHWFQLECWQTALLDKTLSLCNLSLFFLFLNRIKRFSISSFIEMIKAQKGTVACHADSQVFTSVAKPCLKTHCSCFQIEVSKASFYLHERQTISYLWTTANSMKVVRVVIMLLETQRCFANDITVMLTLFYRKARVTRKIIVLYWPKCYNFFLLYLSEMYSFLCMLLLCAQCNFTLQQNTRLKEWFNVTHGEILHNWALPLPPNALLRFTAQFGQIMNNRERSG